MKALHRPRKLASNDRPRKAILEDVIMKMSRVVILFAAVLITVFFTWVLGREQVGAQEEQAIEATAP